MPNQYGTLMALSKSLKTQKDLWSLRVQCTKWILQSISSMVSAATNTITCAELAALASALWIMGQEQNEIAVTDSQASISNYSLCGCFEIVCLAPAWDEMGSEESAHLFLNEVFKRHGLPKQIVSDRGSIFDSAFFVRSADCLELSNAGPPHTILSLMGKSIIIPIAPWKRC